LSPFIYYKLVLFLADMRSPTFPRARISCVHVKDIEHKN